MSKRKLNFVSPGLPLRGKSTDKKINKKAENIQLNPNFGSPLKPMPLVSDDKGRSVDLNLQLRNQEMANRGNDIRNKQKKISEETSSSERKITTSTPPRSTSTKVVSSSTTSGVPLTTTAISNNMAKNNNKSQKSADRDDRNNKRNFGYAANPMNTTTVSFTLPEIPGASDFRAKDDSQLLGNLYGYGEARKVDFNINLLCTNFLNDFETSDITGPEIRPKLILNGSSFSTVFGYAMTDSTNNIDFASAIDAIFHKLDTDVANTLNSYTAPNWSKGNFVAALTDISAALEVYYTLDSILSYEEGSMGDYNINRTLCQYRNMFTTQTITTYRNQIRSFLKGMWFPPNFTRLIMWFYQNYKVNALDQACAFRFVPRSIFFVSDTTGDTFLSTFNLDTVIANIKSGTTAAKISTILNKVAPTGRITTLPASCSDIVYDPAMLEIYANTCIGFNDVNNSNTQSYYPISYKATANDIPYFMDSNTGSGVSGFAYAMQSIPTYLTATSGYVSDYFWGLRAIVTASIKDTSGIVDKTNIQIVTNSSGSIKGYSRPFQYGSANCSLYTCHNRGYWYTQNSNTNNLSLTSQPLAHMQRTYFDNYNGPRVLLSELLNQLFQTRA